MDVFTALQGFKTVLDGLKALSGIRDEALSGAARIDLIRQVLALQGLMQTTLQEKAALAEQVRALEAEVAKLRAGVGDLQRYELHALAGGGTVYLLKAEERGREPPHWLCPNCYANGKKSVFQFSVRSGRGNVYRCTGCGGHMMTHQTPSWPKRPEADATVPDDRPTCRFCRTGRLDLVDSRPHPDFGGAGLKIDTFRCSNSTCGRTDEREFDATRPP